MTNTNATSLRKNLFNVLDNAIKYNEVINVSTKEGNAIIISEEEYNGLLATLELCSNAKLKEKIIKGAKTSNDDCLNIDEANWQCMSNHYKESSKRSSKAYSIRA